RDGALRVIHGGGPEKGQDYMAICGDQVWLDDGSGVANDATCECTLTSGDDAVSDAEPRFDSTMSPAVADIDGDGTPEIVVHNESDQFEVYTNRGVLLATSRGMNNVTNGAVTVANIDNDGLAELVMGRNAIQLSVNGNAWEFTNYFRGNDQRGGISQGPASCVADLVGDEKMEIVGGGTLYRVPDPPDGIVLQDDIVGNCNQFASGSDAREFCEEDLIRVWNTGREGFCAVADVLGADLLAPPSPDNPLDGVPEVILIGEGDLDDEDGDDVSGHVSVISAAGVVVRDIDYNRPDVDLDGVNFQLGDRGGAPNVDDFDGDGFPEVGTAFSAGYGLTDFQPRSAACPLWTDRLESDLGVEAPGSNPARTPVQVMGGCTNDTQCSDLAEGTACNEETGECICLFNNWVRRTEDDSSELTGSSVFDFNGDGAAEVVYNDECAFRIYDGLTGNPLFVEPSESRTRIEYPVVADVDNDGNAEIVFGTSNESGFCNRRRPDMPDLVFNSGVEVWGDASDSWVSARRIWSQHAYHVTNVTENARIPLVEPKGWLATNERFYNIYRSNPRNFGVAPDLEATALQVAGSGGGCGSSGSDGTLIVQVSNVGDLRVGPGVIVGFRGDFGSGFEVLLGPDGTPLRTVIENTLEPRDSIFLSVSYDPANNGETELPAVVRVTVDVSYNDMTEVVTFDTGRERECGDDTNNSIEAMVTNSGPAADLSVGQVSVPACTDLPDVSVTVQNQGTDPAPSGAIVRLYAGDPDQGGSPLGDVMLNAALPAGASTTVSLTPASFPPCSSVRIFAEVDPTNAIAECNDGNNQRGQAGQTFCCADLGG
ncbi:MAG: FG-GAP-like repeat-containing protein, partial [Myxococcota bacterium]